MILAEFDATDARNWASRKMNAFRAAGGDQRAYAQHTVRLVTNKLYQQWRQHLQNNRLQGTGEDLANFISQSYGPAVVQKLRQQFPWLTQEDASMEEPEEPLKLQTEPEQPEPEQQQSHEFTDADRKLYASFQRDANAVKQMFGPMETPPSKQQAVTAIVSMIHKYWGKGPKAEWWVTLFLNELKRNSGVIHVLPSIEHLDPAVWGT